jgi:hypothetical protein
VAQVRPDPAGPAPENRSGYQPHLEEARRLIAGKCAARVSDDATLPLLLSASPRASARLPQAGSS